MTDTLQPTKVDIQPTQDLTLWLEIFETQSRYSHAIDADEITDAAERADLLERRQG